jgi:hypothetical protein
MTTYRLANPAFRGAVRFNEPLSGLGWVLVDADLRGVFADAVPSNGPLPPQIVSFLQSRNGDGDFYWFELQTNAGILGQLLINGETTDTPGVLIFYFRWSGLPVSAAGVSGYADVNPKCTNNGIFVDCEMQGDYWTTYGSQDSEQRVYNANWVHNILGLHGAPGCNCGCTGCQRKVSEAWLTPMVDPKGRLVSYGPSTPGVTPRLPSGSQTPRAPHGTGACPPDPDPDLTVMVVQGRAVQQNPPDTRWQQDDYPPTEGPTDADIRCAGCWWVTTQLGVGDAMEPIMRNGHVVQGVGFEFLPQAPPPVNTDPHQKGPGGGGGGNSGPDSGSSGGGGDPHPSGPEPIGPPEQAYLLRRCLPGQVWNAYRGVCTYPKQLQADALAYSRGLAAPPSQGLGTTTTVVNTTSPATVGLVAALGGTVGMLVGAALGAEIGAGAGIAAARRAAAGGLVGMLVGSFAGAAVTAPSTVSQGA